jgi:hypothetical protein
MLIIGLHAKVQELEGIEQRNYLVTSNRSVLYFFLGNTCRGEQLMLCFTQAV